MEDKKTCCCGCNEHNHSEEHEHSHKSEHNHHEDSHSKHSHEEDSHGCGCGHDHEEHSHDCGCGHDHEHGGEVEKSEIAKILIGVAVFVVALFADGNVLELSNLLNISLATMETLALVLFLVAYFIIGGEVVRGAVRNIMKGHVFDENFLMSVATIGAFFIGEYPEAVAVMIFYQVGELFQDYAVGKSRKSIAALMDIRPDIVYVKLDDGSIVKKEPKDVRIGQIIVVKPGEKVALDGKLAKGEGTIDTKALTGESLPREVSVGDSIISGSISINGVLEIEVEKEFSESTVSKILELVENASSKKAESERFITKFARYYTPVVVCIAVALAVIPPLFIGVNSQEVWSDWVYRALSFLVISCPCALVISVPLSFFGGLGGASTKGILIKGSNYIEALSKCDTVVFDKTGTLTKGNFKVSKVEVTGDIDELGLLAMASEAELYSNHPIALSIKEYLKSYDRNIYNKIESAADASHYEEIAGHGIMVSKDNEILYAGSARLMDKFDISYKPVNSLGTVVYVARNEAYLGAIVIEDEIKDDASEAIKGLSKVGVLKTVMLTGDKRDIAEHVAGIIGVNEVHSQLLPADKVSKVEELLKGQNSKTKLAFVGDGINDAPVLARADIGIAMGGLGQDAAIEAADVVLMDDKPSNIAKAIKIAKKTMRIVRQNIAFAIAVKVGVLVLSALGMTSMWYAVFADVGVSFIAILNALRAMRQR